jgi:hypothetical protein
MKPLKLALRIWFTITSVLSFLIGWALLSHAPKPASIFSLFSSPASSSYSSSNADTTSLNPLPTLAPIPSLDNLITNPDTATTNLQPLPSFSNNVPTNNFVPRLRTRGS